MRIPDDCVSVASPLFPALSHRRPFVRGPLPRRRARESHFMPDALELLKTRRSVKPLEMTGPAPAEADLTTAEDQEIAPDTGADTADDSAAGPADGE